MKAVLVRAASAGVVAWLVAGAVAPVAADCAGRPPINQAMRDADSVFVGTVVTLANSDRWATVAVEEVWTGPDLVGLVQVRGGSDPGSASSIDRQYTARTRYLFFATVDGRTLADNSCSATMLWSGDLAQFRPATARPPVAEPEPVATGGIDLGSFVLPAAVLLAASVLVFGMAFAARRRI